MITTTMYKSMLNSHGNNLGEIRKNQSDRNINATFKTSPDYKRVYILSKDGWKWEDAKFFRHVKQSISADAADSYLQFRPKTHYPIGSYVIIPDDTDFNINLNAYELQNPFLQDINKRTQWWLIINRNDTNYPVYNVLKCNWNFKWIHDGKIQECFGCLRSMSSYGNGIWNDEYSWTLNDLTGAWLPDVYHVYGEKIKEFGICDNRTIAHEQRFIITTNTINPNVYMISHVENIIPRGIIKIKLKEDDYNSKRDNIDLMIADYYTDSGQPNVEVNIDNSIDNTKTSQIFVLSPTPLGVLEVDHMTDITVPEIIKIGESSYYNVSFSDEDIDPEWRIELITDVSDRDKEASYYENLIKITEFDDVTISIKPSKASSLKGLQFKLIVSDLNGDYESYAVLEVES